MSVTAPARDETVSRDGLLASSGDRAATLVELASITALVGWSVALAALMWGTWGNPLMDTGYDSVAAQRVADGQLPYLDFVYWYGPLGPLLLGGMYAVLGSGVGTAVALGLALAIAAVALTYRLARYFVSAPAASAAAALVAPAAFSSANNSYVLPHSTSAPLAVVLTLGLVCALVRHDRVESPARRSLVIAGALAGLVALTRPESALTLFAALGLWYGHRIWCARDARRDAVRDALCVAVPALALPGVVYGGLAAAVGLHDLLFVNLYPRDFVDAAGHVILDAHAPRTAGSVVTLLGHTAVYAIGFVGLLGLGSAMAKPGRPRLMALAVLVLAAVALTAVLAVRPETLRYYLEWAYAWIPAGALIAVVFLARRTRRAALAVPERGVLLVVLLLALVTATTYASFKPFPNARFPEASAYVLPFVAVFLAWLHTRVDRRGTVTGVVWLALLAVASAGLAVHDARMESGRVSGPGGTLTASDEDATTLAGALTLIDRYSEPGDDILIAPQLTSLYTLSGRKPPLPQISLLPGALGDDEEAAAITRMGDVRLVLLDRRPLTAYEHGVFGSTYNQRLADWVRSDFTRVASLSAPGSDKFGIDAWVRKG